MCKYTHFDCPVTPSTIHDCDLTRTSALSVQSPARVPGSDGWPVRRSWWWQNGLCLVDVCPLPLLLHHHQQMQLLAENQPLADRDRHRCCHGSTRWRKLEQLKVATNAKFSQLNVILPLKINETNYCQCKNSQEAARLASLLPGICFVGVTLPICCASGSAFAFLFL